MDIALIAIIAIGIFDGYKKGFVKIVLSFVAILISWFFASELSQPAAVWVSENIIQGWATGAIENLIADSIGKGTEAVLSAIPESLINIGTQAGVSFSEIAAQVGGSVDAAQAAQQIYEAIENNIVISIARIASFVVIFVILNAVLSVAVRLISKLFKLPGLNLVNRLLGASVGAAKGVFLAAIINVAISFIVMVAPESAISVAAEQSVVHNFLSDAIKLLITE
jgi:uncharacterized membrane protein required for colicin V production